MRGSATYLLQRLVQVPLVLVVVTMIVFALVHVTPGDPIQIMLGMETSPQAVEALRQQYNLDKPLPEQYAIWVANAVRGNLGSSIRQHVPVTQMIAERFPISLRLAAVAMLFALLIAIPAGIFSALWRNTWLDYALTGLSIGGLSIPNFALALLLIYAFAIKFDWFPITGIGSAVTSEGGLWGAVGPYILPAVALGVQQTAIVTRMLRSNLLDVLTQDYVRTAHAKGLSDRKVIVGHALKNAIIPVVTVVAIQFGYLVGTTITIEFIFAIPGLGSALLEAVVNRDFPVIQGFTLLMAAFFIVANLVADLLYTIIDPRINYA
ncbi:MAG: ABC transporter permease [Chloroflexi bacterium]|nr:ABC transporter permease [Chloroflexota bacterium]MCL5111224.1 ABC transporter permease [Chloroflexota bacterium]